MQPEFPPLDPMMTPAPPATVSRRALLAGLSRTGCTALLLSGWPGARSAERAVASAQPDVETLRILRSRIELQFAPGFSASLQAAARTWAITSADAVARYFGRFPVPRVELLLVPEEGSGVRTGVTYAEPSLLMRIRLGRDTTESQFTDDGVLVHEMVHLAIPRIPRAQNWLHEGVATYVESVARARVGLVSAETVWREWAKAMPQGQPQAGDAGLDHTPTWGRTYWGGAMFCLLADVELLKRSQLRTGLQQALQGVLAAGGQYGVPWTVERIVATADAAVGQTVLTELYSRMKDSAEPVDLTGLWRDLGTAGGALNDKAPLADVRRAILA
jgi:hypothetical protein